MSKYTCDYCTISTGNKKDYNKHLLTKKHKSKVLLSTNTIPTDPHASPTLPLEQKSYICLNCNNSFARSSGLSRHKKTCMETIIINNEVENLKKETDLLKQQVKQYEKRMDTYEEMIKTLTCPQTINNITFLINSYPDAPVLKELPSYGHILDAKSMSIADVMIMYHETKKLDKFIGDFIVKSYKKDKPGEQSLWSSDISRLTYIINEASKNGGTMWSYDKGGVKLKECVVEPVLNYLRKELFKYYQKNAMKTEIYMIKKKMAINEIIMVIDNDTLANNIVRYIAPKFSINNKNKIKTLL